MRSFLSRFLTSLRCLAGVWLAAACAFAEPAPLIARWTGATEGKQLVDARPMGYHAREQRIRFAVCILFSTSQDPLRFPDRAMKRKMEVVKVGSTIQAVEEHTGWSYWPQPMDVGLPWPNPPQPQAL